MSRLRFCVRFDILHDSRTPELEEPFSIHGILNFLFSKSTFLNKVSKFSLRLVLSDKFGWNPCITSTVHRYKQ